MDRFDDFGSDLKQIQWDNHQLIGVQKDFYHGVSGVPAQEGATGERRGANSRTTGRMGQTDPDVQRNRSSSRFSPERGSGGCELPISIKVGSSELTVPKTIEQRIFILSKFQKSKKLEQVIQSFKQNDKLLIFCGMKRTWSNPEET